MLSKQYYRLLLSRHCNNITTNQLNLNYHCNNKLLACHYITSLLKYNNSCVRHITTTTYKYQQNVVNNNNNNINATNQTYDTNKQSNDTHKNNTSTTNNDTTANNKSRRTLRRTIWQFTKYTTLFITISVGSIYTYCIIFDRNTKEKIDRLTYFWSHMLPIYIHYKFAQKIQLRLFPLSSDEEYDKFWDTMHERYADTVLNLVLHQRGVYIKLAQIGAVKPDIVPKAYCQRFTILQDGVPPQPGSYARHMIEHAFNRSVDSLFSEFNDKAIGSATIGQVHSAKLHDGRDVVVKIQYPEVQRLFDSDMSTLKAFVRLAQPEHLPMFNEMEKAFQIEFDFKREAYMMDRIYNDIMYNQQFNKYVEIPHSIDGLVSKYVMCMTKLDGIKLIDGLKNEQKKLAAKQGISVEQLEAEMKNKVLNNEKPNFKAPNKLLVSLYSNILNIATTSYNILISIYNYSIGYITHYKLTYKLQPIVINPQQIIELLNNIHSYELFISGVVNCDPHPGNILLLNNGRIGLIDYGQTNEFDIYRRCMLARLMILLANNDEEGIAQHYEHMGVKTAHMSKYVLNKLAQLGFNDDGYDVTEGMNTQLFFEHLNELDEIIQVSDGYLMASRIGMLLRGLGSWIGVPHKTAQAFKHNAQLCLQIHKHEWDTIKCCG